MKRKKTPAVTKPTKTSKAASRGCTLLTPSAVRECIWQAINAEYKTQVNDATSLGDPSGLGLDETEIRDNLYEVIKNAVEAKGCQLTQFAPDDLLGCKTVGDIVKRVGKDLLSNTTPAVSKATEINKATSSGCTLLTKRDVRKCIWQAINEEYDAQVDDATSLRDRSGLGLDEIEIRDNLYEVIKNAVEAKGCHLTKFTPSALLACQTVGDIVGRVAEDLLAKTKPGRSKTAKQIGKLALLLFTAFMLEIPFAPTAQALTDAERQQAITQNTADLKRAADAGDLEAASAALEALKMLKPAPQPPANGNQGTAENPALRKFDDAFTTLSKWGLSLSRSPDAGDEGKGAHVGFIDDRHAGSDTAFDAEFYLQWDMLRLFTAPPLYLGPLRVDAFGPSVQGKLTSTDNTAADAWRFRLEGQSYLRFENSIGGVLKGVDFNYAVKDESDRDFHLNRISAELWLTPLAHQWCIGQWSGGINNAVQFRWRPYAGIDAGGTATDASAAGERDSAVWLMPKCKVELALNFIRAGLGVKDVVLSAEDRLVYLTGPDEAHNYLKTDLSLQLTDSMGFAFEYSVGEDSPKFQREDLLTGSLTVKF
jgi:hypothetical protein